MGRAGQLDRRVRIERANAGRDNLGGSTDQGWHPLGTYWAERMDASDAERFVAQEHAATRMTRFRIRSTAITRTVTPADRAVHDGDVYEIIGVKETKEGRNNYIEMTTVVRADG